MVIAIIGILAGILLPVLATAKERAIRIKCLNNIKQIDLGWLQYGNENADLLYNGNQGYWLWDLPGVVFQVMARQGVTRALLYDPAFPQQDTLWYYATATDYSGYHVTGYCYTYPGIGTQGNSMTGNYATNLNYKISPDFIQMPGGPGNPAGSLVQIDPSRRPLTACAVICAGSQPGSLYSPAQPASIYNFSDVQGGAGVFPDGRHHRAPHTDTTHKIPTGGNTGMLDGSAKWVNFRSATYNMIQRDAAQPPNGTPIFIW